MSPPDVGAPAIAAPAATEVQLTPRLPVANACTVRSALPASRVVPATVTPDTAPPVRNVPIARPLAASRA